MRSLSIVAFALLIGAGSAWAGAKRRERRETATQPTVTAPTPVPAPASPEVVYLDQAWTARDRAAWYWTSQGSAMMSYDLFLALEVADGTELFRSDAVSERFGLIPERADPTFNPDGLPVGLAKTSVEDGQFAGDWVGPTCALCHTNQLRYQGKEVRIDGGSTSRLDYNRWLAALDEALIATLKDGAKLARTVQRVRERAPQATEELVRRGLTRDSGRLHTIVSEVCRPPYPTGPRLDALGDIHNELEANRPGIPQNSRPPNAPVKMPFVWNAPQSAWVQWSGAGRDPFFRNFTETLGVFALYDLTSSDRASGLFECTTDVRGLVALEELVRRLAPPKWPEQVLGPIDATKAAAGEQLFGELCAGCHTTWPYRWSDARAEGKRFIENTFVPADLIGTDPTQLDGVTFDPAPTMLTGALASYVGGQARASEGDFKAALVAELAKSAMADAGAFTREELTSLHGYEAVGAKPPAPVRSYKAAPRDGVWATGPFLHNGSVPNLYELLLPAAQRSRTFAIGRGFDPVRVGVDTTGGPGVYVFDTALPGNANTGHSFEAGRGKGIVGRELTDAERWALVEYLKSLPGEAGRVTPYGGPPNPKLAAEDPAWYNTKHPY